MINCRISFEVKNPKMVLHALEPELSSEVGRSKAKFTAGKTLICEIESPDITALRAAVNNYLRLIHTITKVSEDESN